MLLGGTLGAELFTQRISFVLMLVGITYYFGAKILKFLAVPFALLLSAIPIAIFTNAARVTATGVLSFYYGRKAAESLWHELSGWLVYIAALLFLLSINFGLKKFKV